MQQPLQPNKFSRPEPPELERAQSTIYAWLPSIGLMTAIVILICHPIEAAWNSPILLLAFNALFLSTVSLVISILAVHSYLTGQGKSVLLLGCGTLALGLGAIIAGLPPTASDPNYTATVYNTAALLAAVCHLTGTAWALWRRPQLIRPKGFLIAVLYASIIFLLILLTVAARGKTLPAYFIDGSGATAWNRGVLWIAASLFAWSATLLWRNYRKSRSEFLRWYSMGLALLTVGLIAVSFQRSFGTPLNWMGRAAQYLGGIYILISVISAVRKGRSWTVSLETALRQSEERYRSLVEVSPDAILVMRDERVTFANPAAARLFAAAIADHMLGRSLFDFLQSNCHSAMRERMRMPQNGAVVPPIEVQICRFDGNLRDVEIAIAAFEETDGQAVQVILRDITERKRVEETLRETEERFRTVLDNSRDGINMVDLKTGRYIFMSLAQMKLTGFSAKELQGLSAEEAYERVHPEDREIWISQQKQVAAGQDSGMPVEYRWKVKSGEYRWFSDSRSAVRDAQGQAVALVEVSRDITDRKKAEEELMRSRAELEYRVEERTKELSQTAETLADEVAQRIAVEQDLRKRSDQLRSLASELALTEQRERMRLAQILHDGLQQILVAAKYRVATAERSQHLKTLVDEITDLLDDAIETSRSLTSELSPPILREGGLVPAIEWLARWMRDRHGLDVRLTVRDNIDPSSEDIVLLLFQAARELLFNIVKHAFAKAANLELAQADGHIQVIVEDKGIGFNPTEIPAQKGASGGFGLFSIRERVSLLGGHMEISSAPGQGSRFTLAVPLSAGMIESHPSSETDVSPVISLRRQLKTSSAPNSIRIVLVDDHIIVRQGIAGLLAEEPDFEIIGEASDGASAVNLVSEVRPDVVLMDISMPGMNGIEATQIIHKEWLVMSTQKGPGVITQKGPTQNKNNE
jgi:PAS domain S-box-containing protein